MLKNPDTVGIEAIAHILKPPKGACAHVERFLNKRDINSAQAAKAISVDRSTMKRFLDGGSLTESMAAKLNATYGLDIETLFNLEAKARIYKSQQLAKSLVA